MFIKNFICFGFKFKDEEWKPATVNSYTKGGYKIVDVQHQSGVLFYTLQKSKKVMKKIQKLAFQKHKNNIRNNKFRPKTNKIFNKHKK